MLLIINGDDWVGQLLIQDKNAINSYLHLRSTDVVNSLSIGSNETGLYLYYQNEKYYVNEFSGVYYGISKYHDSQSNRCANLSDLHYISSSWNALLNYIIAVIPAKLGALSHEHWTSTIWQLPVLYNLLGKHDIQSPFFNFSVDGEKFRGMSKEFYYLSSLFVSSKDEFEFSSRDHCLEISRFGNYWVYIMVVGSQTYGLIYISNGWRFYKVKNALSKKLILFCREYKINLCQFIFRLDTDLDVLKCYGLTRKCAPIFDDFYRASLKNIILGQVL